MTDWFKSSYSSETGTCVEVKRSSLFEGAVQVRDSKDVAGPVVGFSRGAWSALVGSVAADPDLS